VVKIISNRNKVITWLSTSRENEGTARDIKGVGWYMSIPLKLFLVLYGIDICQGLNWEPPSLSPHFLLSAFKRNKELASLRAENKA